MFQVTYIGRKKLQFYLHFFQTKSKIKNNSVSETTAGQTADLYEYGLTCIARYSYEDRDIHLFWKAIAHGQNNCVKENSLLHPGRKASLQ